jgi:hypothetical protein
LFDYFWAVWAASLSNKPAITCLALPTWGMVLASSRGQLFDLQTRMDPHFGLRANESAP